MENPIKMDDLGVPPFKETPIYIMSIKRYIKQSEFPHIIFDLHIFSKNHESSSERVADNSGGSITSVFLCPLVVAILNFEHAIAVCIWIC